VSSSTPRLPATPTDADIAEYVRATREQQGLPRYIEGYGLARILDLLVGPLPAVVVEDGAALGIAQNTVLTDLTQIESVDPDALRSLDPDGGDAA
jgi:hypothetical protein